MSFSQFNVYTGLTPARVVATSNQSGTYKNGVLNNGNGATFVYASGVLTIDSVVVVLGDRVLFAAQDAANQNGVYVCTAQGAVGIQAVLTRASDQQSQEQLHLGQYIPVYAGTADAGSVFILCEPLPAQFGISDMAWLDLAGVDGPFGTAATKDASDNTKSTVASVSGATTANALAVFADTAGTVKDATTTTTLGQALSVTGGITAATGNIAASQGNVVAGSSGHAGTVSSFPSTSAKGALLLVGVANTGNTNTTISNVAMGQASVISIPDPAGATANFVVAPAALVSGNVVKASGTAGLVADAGFSVKANTTAAYGGGGTSNAFTATGLGTTSIVTAVILTSTNAVSIAKAVPTANTLTVTFSADPGAGTTVSWIAITPAV